MASNSIFVVSTIVAIVIVGSLTRVNSMPMMTDSSEIWSTDRPTSMEVIDGSSPRESNPLEVEDTKSSPIPMKIERRSIVESKNVDKSFKSDIEQNDNNVISEEHDNVDDLETAAGTNILRPLFVYRQQLAYRERVRKAGRREAPNF